MLNILGEYVAQFKITVLILPTGPSKITGLPFDETLYKSEHSVNNQEIKVITIYSLYFRILARNKFHLLLKRCALEVAVNSKNLSV